jgi:phosphoserine phosphatase
MSQISTKYTAASFFDLDGTLLSCNGSFRFGLYLFMKGHVSLSKFTILLWNYMLFKIGKLSIEDLHTHSFQTFFKNQNVNVFKKLASEFVDIAFERLINRVVFSELVESQKGDELTVILSSSPEFLVEQFAKKCQTNLYFGTNYQTINGQWIEIAQILEGESKAEYFYKICDRFAISPSKTKAYSDHHNDLPLLENAGEAIAVSPTRQLETASIKRGWRIIRP